MSDGVEVDPPALRTVSAEVSDRGEGCAHTSTRVWLTDAAALMQGSLIAAQVTEADASVSVLLGRISETIGNYAVDFQPLRMGSAPRCVGIVSWATRTYVALTLLDPHPRVEVAHVWGVANRPEVGSSPLQ